MPNHQSNIEGGTEADCQHDWREQEAKRSFVNRILFVHHRHLHSYCSLHAYGLVSSLNTHAATLRCRRMARRTTFREKFIDHRASGPPGHACHQNLRLFHERGSFRRFKTESKAHRSPGCSGRVHLLVGQSLNSIPSGKSGPTGMNCSSTRFAFERGRLSSRARASATSLQFSRKMTPLPSPRVNHC